MATSRNPKRARKKDRRNARREEWRRMVQKRRRQRWGVLLGSLAVIGVGALIAYVAFRPEEKVVEPQTIKAPVKEPVGCKAKVPPTAGSEKKQYDEPTDQKLDPKRVYLLKLETSCGDIEIELDVKNAPKTSNSIAFLAREGFYDGLLFHRVVPDFVLQGGDPQGTGNGDPGYDVVEPPPEDQKYTKGTLAMAKGGTDPPGTSGSQFFIVSGKEGGSLTPDYAVAGKVTDGMDVVSKIEKYPGGDIGGPPPETWVYIEKATIQIKVGAKSE